MNNGKLQKESKPCREKEKREGRALGDRDCRCSEPPGSVPTSHPGPCCHWRDFIHEAEKLQRNLLMYLFFGKV